MVLISRGWCICIVYTNEVISEIWRTNDAMSSLRSSWLYLLWHHRGIQRYRCQACRRIFQTLPRGKDPALKQRACQLHLEGIERSAGFSVSITRRSLAGWSKLPKHSRQTHHRPKSAPSTKSMNSARSSLKKISMLALASGRLHLWQGPRLCLWKKDDQNG